MIEPEQWRAIAGYEGSYEISDHGNVRSLPRKGGDGKNYKGRVLKPSTTARSRIRQIILFKDGERYSSTIHKLVLHTFVGEPKPGEEAIHNDGDAANNHVSNLQWGTSVDNAQAIIARGNNIHRRKERCPRGHLLELPNLTAYSIRQNWRSCLSCSKAHRSVKDYKSEAFKVVSDLIYRDIMGEQDQ